MARYAIYLTTLPDDDLTEAASRWLGRDAFSGKVLPQATIEGFDSGRMAELTQAPRCYGFHGTLKAPFYLHEGTSERDLLRSFELFCLSVPPIDFPDLVIGSLDGFFALVPPSPNPELATLADNAVETFDRFRRPPSMTEIERRNVSALSDEARRNLFKWGYPYVKELFRFHMTLTRRVGANEQDLVRQGLDSCLGEALRAPARTALAVFMQPEPATPFVVRAWHRIDARQSARVAS